jgi:glutathione S-transferase
MADELVLYTHPMSRGRIARWMLEEVGQPYRTDVLDYGGKMKSPEYLAINPMGKVPAIRHGDTVITECAAICAYLADAFPQAKLAPPPGDRLRGPYYRWLFFAAGPLEAAVTNKGMGFEVPPDRKPMSGYGSYADVLAAIDGLLSRQDYCAGDHFTAADVYLGSHVGWGMQFGSLEKRASFEKYWQRVSSRPAARRANEIDDALMPKHPVPGMKSQA